MKSSTPKVEPKVQSRSTSRRQRILRRIGRGLKPIYCTGTGTPTVILEAGAYSYSTELCALQIGQGDMQSGKVIIRPGRDVAHKRRPDYVLLLPDVEQYVGLINRGESNEQMQLIAQPIVSEMGKGKVDQACRWGSGFTGLHWYVRISYSVNAGC